MASFKNNIFPVMGFIVSYLIFNILLGLREANGISPISITLELSILLSIVLLFFGSITTFLDG